MKERRPRKRQPLTLPCMDCRVDTVEIGEYFMINNNELWAQAMGDADGILCIGCLERRLDRTLTAFDFIDAPINNPRHPTISARMRNRLTAECSRAVAHAR